MLSDFDIWKKLELRLGSREQIAAVAGLSARQVSEAHARFVGELAKLSPFSVRVARILLVELGISPADLRRPAVLAGYVGELDSLPRLGKTGKAEILAFVAPPSLAAAA